MNRALTAAFGLLPLGVGRVTPVDLNVSHATHTPTRSTGAGSFFLMGLTVRALGKPSGLLLGVVLGVGAPLLMSFSVLTVLGLKNSLVLLAGHSSALDATLGRMRAEHFSHEADAPRAVIGPVLHRQLAREAAALETDLEEHLRFEEFELFPFLDEALPATTQERIIQELRARRRTRV